MGDMFRKDGTLNIPIHEEIIVPKSKVDEKEGELVLYEAYCSDGHSLMSDVKIGRHNGIHFLYTDREGKKEAEIVISPVIGSSTKIILKGDDFGDDEIVRIFCPVCRKELPTLFDCECGAPIYLFYIDSSLDYNYGQSFCSRLGCVQASRLRFSCDMVKEFMRKYCF
jgi:hypothetical protein